MKIELIFVEDLMDLEKAVGRRKIIAIVEGRYRGENDGFFRWVFGRSGYMVVCQ